MTETRPTFENASSVPNATLLERIGKTTLDQKVPHYTTSTVLIQDVSGSILSGSFK